jgi:hypothetical protein
MFARLSSWRPSGLCSPHQVSDGLDRRSSRWTTSTRCFTSFTPVGAMRSSMTLSGTASRRGQASKIWTNFQMDRQLENPW